MHQVFEKYINEIAKTYFSKEAKEVSYRSALENLLNEINTDKQILVIQEGKREGRFGIPDFKIKQTESIIGYIETKDIGENLDKILKTDQLKKYIELSDNIILTDYLEFIWIRKGEINQRARLCNLTDLQPHPLPLSKGEGRELGEVVRLLLQNFFSTAPEGIASPKILAQCLALRAKLLKDSLQTTLLYQVENEKSGRLCGLYETFKEFLFEELTVEQFTDAFAQMLVYGLFLARLNADTQKITLINAKEFIHLNFYLIYELVTFLDVLKFDIEYKETQWIVEEILTIMNGIDLPAISVELSFNKKEKDDYAKKDPYIYFYEDFLAAYNPQMRKAKGVYYTPPPVVNFIIRAVNEVLQNVFEIPKGLADREKVTVLDFATGTGTFLLEILEQIFENEPSPAKREMLVKEHILKNIYGFEYLIAPYTIAHLKLSQFLKDKGYTFGSNERLQIFLTNTLEQADKQARIPLLPALTAEINQAQKVKEQPILVICGNPPYSYISKNNGAWISHLLKDYYKIDGQKLNEKNPKGLQDDYVKFIRFAQWKMEQVEEGIVAIITNHSFLDNPTFRGMRQSLMQTFDRLYFLDLHGNAKKKEKTPESGKDENVFDIEQGVAVSMLVKKKGLKKQVYHANYYGLRKDKYAQALADSLKTVQWQELKPNSPFYWFVKKEQKNIEFYNNFYPLDKIFKINSMGIATSRDKLLIDFDKKSLLQKIKKLIDFNIPENILINLYGLKNKTNFNLTEFRLQLSKEKNIAEFIKTINYRVFDKRYIFFHPSLIERARQEVMKQLERGENLGLCCVKIGRDINAHNYFVTASITDKSITSSLDNANIFPLYLYEKTEGLFVEIKEIRKNKELLEVEKQFRKYHILHEKHKKDYEYMLEKYQKKPSEDAKILLEDATTSFEESQSALEEWKLLLDKLQKQNTQGQKAIKDLLPENTDYLKSENFTKEFRKFINERYGNPTPEQILGYCYAVLHSNHYREKYAEFLKTDFPRIPFIQSLEGFRNLANLGAELIEAHLLRKIPNVLAVLYEGIGSNEMMQANYVAKDQRLYINKTQYFEKIPQEVYDFQIGGYQVLDKYLKDRKGRNLGLEEIETIEKIIKALAFTISQMQEIDKQTKDWIYVIS